MSSDRQATPLPNELNLRELLRWAWRQLTSMRTALVLLLLLALAAIPGSIFPQEDIDSPGGSSRWKQRALYDAMKDAAAYAADSDYPLARLSVHDTVNGVRLGSVLQGKANADPDALIALVRERLHTRVT